MFIKRQGECERGGWLGSAAGAIVIVKLRVIEVCLKLKMFEIDINGKSFRICLSE